jgi:hypothetical protein
MSKLNTIREIDTEIKEGQCLIAALVLLGCTSRNDKMPDEIYKEVMNLANEIYHLNEENLDA